MSSGCRAVFVTGTDTDAGKTYVSALLVRHLRAAGHSVGAYKPVVSGAVPAPAGRNARTGSIEPTDRPPEGTDDQRERWAWPDVEILREACGFEPASEPAAWISLQRFREPLAPPMAARQEGRSVCLQTIRRGLQWWLERVEFLLIEGAGGLLCPLTETLTVADLAASCACPILLVARAELGTINHTLLTVAAARQRRMSLAGIVVNQTDPNTPEALVSANVSEIERRGGVPVLAVVRYGETRLPPPRPNVTIRWEDAFGPLRAEAPAAGR
ncbi:MAG: dethiobiotin synthase [Planctomycetota bacterium]|nr:MAG: dethiobiotin synthase [Planctomycetota bacterium]